MKKLIVICLVVALLVPSLVSCGAEDATAPTDSSKESTVESSIDTEAPVTSIETEEVTETEMQTETETESTPASSPAKSGITIDPDLEVVKEYIIKDDDRVTRCLAIKNNSTVVVSVDSNTAAYSDKGIVSAESAYISALAAGSTGLLIEEFSTEEAVVSFESNISKKDQSRNIIPLTDFSCETTVLSDKAILQCKYDGELESIDTYIHTIFIKDGEPIYVDWEHEELPKGIVISVQINSWGIDFDSVEVYADGYEFK